MPQMDVITNLKMVPVLLGFWLSSYIFSLFFSANLVNPNKLQIRKKKLTYLLISVN